MAAGDGLGPFARPTNAVRGAKVRWTRWTSWRRSHAKLPKPVTSYPRLAKEVVPDALVDRRSGTRRRGECESQPANSRQPPPTLHRRGDGSPGRSGAVLLGQRGERLAVGAGGSIRRFSALGFQAEVVGGMAGFDLAPSTGVDEGALFGATYAPSNEAGEEGGGGWGESLGEVPLPPSFTEESLLLNGDVGGAASQVGRQSGEGWGEGVLSFEPHTQGRNAPGCTKFLCTGAIFRPFENTQHAAS